MKYKQRYDGDWLHIPRRGHKVACCDCGLVHRFNGLVKGRRIYIQVFRDVRSTGQKRRHKNVKLVKK